MLWFSWKLCDIVAKSRYNWCNLYIPNHRNPKATRISPKDHPSYNNQGFKHLPPFRTAECHHKNLVRIHSFHHFLNCESSFCTQNFRSFLWSQNSSSTTWQFFGDLFGMVKWDFLRVMWPHLAWVKTQSPQCYEAGVPLKSQLGVLYKFWDKFRIRRTLEFLNSKGLLESVTGWKKWPLKFWNKQYSLSTWKWMVGILSRFLLGRLGLFLGANR